MPHETFTRREILRGMAAGAAVSAFPISSALNASEKNFVYPVGAWMGGIGCFEKARSLGLDQVQISFPLRPGGGNDLRKPEIRDAFLNQSSETGVKITSLAMGEFNSHPFWEIPDAVERVSECIETMARMRVKYVLISYFGKGALNTDEKFEETIRRYRELAPKAEAAGVVLAIESPLKADGHLRILEGVNSPAVRVYYDPGNMIHVLGGSTEKVCEDILALKGLIVEAHAKDSTVLGKGKIDYAKIFQAYREAGFFGSQVIEGSIDKDLGYDESIRQNAAFIRSLNV